MSILVTTGQNRGLLGSKFSIWHSDSICFYLTPLLIQDVSPQRAGKSVSTNHSWLTQKDEEMGRVHTNRVVVSVCECIHCVTTTVKKVEKKRNWEQKWEWGVGEYAFESTLGVAVQSLSLVVSLSNEALWSRGSHPSLGPHTSLMFPHHSPDNYRGRECHPQSRLLNRGWQHRVCGLPDVSRVHRILHAHAPGVLSTHSQICPLYVKWTICVLLLYWQHMGCMTPLALFQQTAQLFLTFNGKYL